MKKFRPGEIVFVDLNPAKGVETSKKRPCVIVSNNQYNDLLNILIIAITSSNKKYQEHPKYKESPLFINLPEDEKITCMIILKYLRSIDSKARINQSTVSKINEKSLERLRKVVQQFFQERWIYPFKNKNNLCNIYCIHKLFYLFKDLFFYLFYFELLHLKLFRYSSFLSDFLI